jgi:ribosomal protein L44E
MKGIRYCSYCKKETLHKLQSGSENESGTCTICSSSKPTKIQGFSADLM